MDIEIKREKTSDMEILEKYYIAKRNLCEFIEEFNNIVKGKSGRIEYIKIHKKGIEIRSNINMCNIIIESLKGIEASRLFTKKELGEYIDALKLFYDEMEDEVE